MIDEDVYYQLSLAQHNNYMFLFKWMQRNLNTRSDYANCKCHQHSISLLDLGTCAKYTGLMSWSPKYHIEPAREELIFQKRWESNFIISLFTLLLSLMLCYLNFRHFLFKTPSVKKCKLIMGTYRTHSFENHRQTRNANLKQKIIIKIR